MKVAFYIRVSTDRQETEGQLYELRAWADREHHEIVKVYADVMSGARRRESLDTLLEDAHKGHFEMVAFWRLDRLTREGVIATLLYLDTLNKLNIGIYSHQESWLNPTMPFYSVVVAVVAELAAMERTAISERTKMGLDRARRQGVKLGRPLGSKDGVKRKRSGYLKRYENGA